MPKVMDRNLRMRRRRIVAVAWMATIISATAPLAQASDALPLVMRTAIAADPITPQTASDARTPLQARAKQMHDSGDDVGAANLLMAEAQRLKDPVLYLDAGDAFLAVAKADNNLQWLDGAKQMADIALDMLFYLRDNAGSDKWRPVAQEHVPLVLERAEAFEARLRETEGEIEAALAAASQSDEAPAAPEPKVKSGKGMFIAGAVLTSIGVAGVGVAGAGMAIGARAQRDVTDPTVYFAEHQAAEIRGRNANVVAYAGAGAAAVGLGAGIALMVIGKKRMRAAGSASRDEVDDTSDASAQVSVLPALRGLTIQGTF